MVAETLLIKPLLYECSQETGFLKECHAELAIEDDAPARTSCQTSFTVGGVNPTRNTGVAWILSTGITWLLPDMSSPFNLIFLINSRKLNGSSKATIVCTYGPTLP
ncbi:hypothetical protein L1887_03292 [Cichorium endivia]|nr:hypothetical protein L1887_03292 [Cichorium endivia]